MSCFVQSIMLLYLRSDLSTASLIMEDLITSTGKIRSQYRVPGLGNMDMWLLRVGRQSLDHHAFSIEYLTVHVNLSKAPIRYIEFLSFFFSTIATAQRT